MSPSLISVFVITYNHEATIAEALESILNQRLALAWEVVIGEDCSTDRTREICQGYAERNPTRVRLLPSTGNLGMMGNFLRTMKACNGELIAFCEGDDYWTDPQKLQKQVDFLEQKPEVVFCFHGARILDVTTGRFQGHYKHSMFRTGVVKKEYMFEKGGGSFPSASILFRSSMIKYPTWFTNCPVADLPLLFLALEAGEVGYIDEEMSVYRLNSGGSWTESFKSFQRYLDYFNNETACISEFDAESGFRYARNIWEFNSLRRYRLVLKYFRSKPSVLSRLRFLFSQARYLSVSHFAKSFYRSIFK